MNRTYGVLLVLSVLFTSNLIAADLPECGHYGPAALLNGDTATAVQMFYASGNSNHVSAPSVLFTPEYKLPGFDTGRTLIAGCLPEHVYKYYSDQLYATNTFVDGDMTKQIVTQSGEEVTLEYTYNEGRLRSAQEICFSGGDPTLITDMSFHYMSDGRLERMTRTGPEGCSVYEGYYEVKYSYDNSLFTHLPTAAEVYKDGVLQDTYSVSYERSQNNMVSQLIFTWNTTSYVYNFTYEDDLLITMTYEKTDGTGYEYIFNYKYEDGALVEVTSNSPDLILETINYKDGLITEMHIDSFWVKTDTWFDY